MNHLRGLLETHVDNIRVLGQKEKISLPSLMEYVKRDAENSVCFDIGFRDEWHDFAVLPELCELPYDTTWFEYQYIRPTGAPGVSGVLAARKNDGVFLCEFVWLSGTWIFVWSAKMDRFNGRFVQEMCPGDSSRERMHLSLRLIAQFLSALHCTNVFRQRHPPSEKLQKARTKRGKAPLFSYWTLQLGQKNERGESLGGTHASPRVHLRRGHPRQYAPGKYTWVQPHAVGHRELGMVHKDYSGAALTMV